MFISFVAFKSRSVWWRIFVNHCNYFIMQDRTKLSEYVMKCFGTPLEEVELCVRGMNWGEVEFQGPLLRFMADKKPAFEITLNDVSNVTTGKNEVTLQFHQNDSAPVSLMEMRLHIPLANDGEEDSLQVLHYRHQLSLA